MKRKPRSRSVLVGVLAGVVCLCGWLASTAAANTSVAFTTQGCTPWTVPAGVTSVHIQATGAAGAAGTQFVDPDFGAGALPGVGGFGDEVSGTLSGLSGGTTVLYVCVNQGGGTG